MREDVALITGAGSGIGQALAWRCAKRGMHLVLVDLDEAGLATTAQSCEGAPSVAMERVNVGSAGEMEALCRRVHAQFDALTWLFNNAGVSGGGTPWEASVAQWEWTLDANLWGVIHGLRCFVPRMIEQDAGHVVNTASIAGLITAPDMALYNTTKQAVVGLTESLYVDLRQKQSSVGCSVLCPSFVNTQIYRSAGQGPDARAAGVDPADIEAVAGEFFAQAMDADTVVEQTLAAIDDRRFYVFSHPEQSKALVDQRLQTLLADGAPPMTGPDFPL